MERVVNTFTGLGAAFTGGGFRAVVRRVLATQSLSRLLTPGGWRVTFQNSEDMEQLVRAGIVNAGQCHVIAGSGVDPRCFELRQEPDGVPLVMLASRMIWPKGVREFVAAASLLKQLDVQARFVLVGDTDPGSRVAVPVKQLARWDRGGIVEWWGNCSNMPETIGLASIVVLPTFYGEGLPKVLLEAASCGKPLVATDVRGCREIVRHHHNGVLIPPRDPEALSNAIWQLLDQPELRKTMGSRGRKIVQRHFTSRQVTAQTLGIYHQMVGTADGCERRAA